MPQLRYFRRLTRADVPALQAASAELFAFDPHDLQLADVVEDERWFCLAAVASSGPEEPERVVGFAAAALGSVAEFALEQPHLSSALEQHRQQQLASRAEAATLPPQAVATAGMQQAPVTDASSKLALEVVLLGVLPGSRRQGVGSRLLQAMKRHARARGAALLFLHVQHTNQPARRLYAKAGLVRAAVMRSYYSHQLEASTKQRKASLGPGEQQQQPAASSGSGWSTADDDRQPAGPGAAGQHAFAGADALLLVQLLARDTASASRGDPAAAGSSSSRGKLASPSLPEWFAEDSEAALAAALAAAGPSRRPQSAGASDASSCSSATSSSSNSSNAVGAVAAAAASALLGGALSLLTGGAFGRGGAARSRWPPDGRPGRVVNVGGELMVEVRADRDVVLLDADELPADVVLSSRDAALLGARRQPQPPPAEQPSSSQDDDGDDQGGSSVPDAGAGSTSVRPPAPASSGSQQAASIAAVVMRQPIQAPRRPRVAALQAPARALNRLLVGSIRLGPHPCSLLRV